MVTYIDAPEGGFTPYDNGFTHQLIAGTDYLRERSFKIDTEWCTSFKYVIVKNFQKINNAFAEVEKIIESQGRKDEI